MRGYKSVARRWADDFAAGNSIRLGSFASYREGEKGRADPDEGLGGYRQSIPLAFWPGMPDELRPQIEAALRKIGCPAPPPDMPNVHIAAFDNMVSFEVPPMHIFCASVEADFPTYGDEAALFEISDLDLFAHRICKAAADRLWSRFHIGRVCYQSNFIDPLMGDASFDPFKKDPAFAADQEVRILFSPLPHVRKELALMVSAPRVAPLIRRLR